MPETTIRKSTGKDICAFCRVLIPKGSEVYEFVPAGLSIAWMENRCWGCKDRKDLTA